MTDPAAAFERYKDALRRGHVAALRNQLADALDAYQEAAALAPDRALPLTSRGTVQLRLGHAEDALASFDEALGRAPRDEVALGGRAEALRALGRRPDAAAAFDALVDLHERAGRLTAATEAARTALDLVESRHRRALLRELADRLAEAPPDEAATRVLERARAMLDVGDTTAADVPPGATPEPAGAPAPADPATPAPEPPVPPPPDIAALTRRADDALDIGDTATAREAFLQLARAHREAGRIDAGLDAGYLALSIAPGNVELHLELVALYLERGWRAPAAEKVRLLGRLVDLADDPADLRRFEATVAGRFPDVIGGGPSTD